MRTVLLTGATSGIGRQTAFDLAARGVRLVVHGRSADQLDALVAALAEAHPAAPPARPAQADLADLGAVVTLGEQLADRLDRLDVLLHNAGVYDTARHETVDGFERTLAVNHLAPFALTRPLLGLLRATAAQHGEARVVTVASIAHNSGRMRWDDLMLERGWEPPGAPRPGYAAYAQSKLANVLFSRHLSGLLAGSGVTSNSLHPGVIDTKLLRAGFDVRGAPLSEGSKTSVRVALDPTLTGVSGAYFSDGRRVGEAPQARDDAAAARLWATSARLVDAATAG